MAEENKKSKYIINLGASLVLIGIIMTWYGFGSVMTTDSVALTTIMMFGGPIFVLIGVILLNIHRK